MYCNTVYCIAAWECRLARIVSQYAALYCSKKARSREDCVAVQFTVL